MAALPGNHDLNVVDRANPARLDLPTSPKKRLRQVRTMSALAAIQGARARVVAADTDRVGVSVEEALAPSAQQIVDFADRGSRKLARGTDAAWNAVFPMVFPPARDDGLGIIALNSNAETHFSFTNALGLVPRDEAHALDAAVRQYPRATWIVALHHHIVEHPKLGHALAERIGTTLINGNWITRHLRRLEDRVVVMHGHRHIDWMGRCGELLILSAPSATMPRLRARRRLLLRPHDRRRRDWARRTREAGTHRRSSRVTTVAETSDTVEPASGEDGWIRAFQHTDDGNRTEDVRVASRPGDSRNP